MHTESEEKSIAELKSILQEIDTLSNSYWMTSLEDRKRKELQFHDKFRNSNEDNDKEAHEKIHGSQRYQSIMADTDGYMFEWIDREAKGRVFLDYCCGDGGIGVHAALSGAKLSIGIDLSRVSIQNARNYAKRCWGGVDNFFFLQSDAEDTKFPDNSIDRVVCSGVLHHLDTSKAFKELYRILAPGGKILCIEALNYNPFFKLYRYLTPEMRTDWEKAHILSMKDVKYAKNFFEVTQLRFWHIFRVLEPHLPQLNFFFRALDNFFTKIPLIQLMSWVFSFELIKKKE